jgi:hypothetical protein
MSKPLSLSQPPGARVVTSGHALVTVAMENTPRHLQPEHYAAVVSGVAVVIV